MLTATNSETCFGQEHSSDINNVVPVPFVYTIVLASCNRGLTQKPLQKASEVLTDSERGRRGSEEVKTYSAKQVVARNNRQELGTPIRDIAYRLGITE